MRVDSVPTARSDKGTLVTPYLPDLLGKVVMVTGAAGSIGSDLCNAILRARPNKLICVDRAETPLFYLQKSLSKCQNTEICHLLGDVSNHVEMGGLIAEYGVEVIFHAAAYKHVSIVEANPHVAIENNVFALLGLVEVAEETGCRDFVLLSSDKAVRPSSVMGCTKRLGEMILVARPSGMRCFSVRFGNVMGSQGSVIPIFLDQILSRGRVEITHPEMTRYFISIQEAASLILRAFSVGERGDVLVFDMGEPIRIVDLAETLLRIVGKSRDEVEIVYTGMRPGEKLHEELCREEEMPQATGSPGIFRTKQSVADWETLSGQLQELREIARTGDGERIRKCLRRIIPDFGS